MPISAALPALAAVAVLAGAALTGCSSDETARNASVLTKPVRVCVINDSPSRAEVTWLSAEEVSGDTVLWEYSGDTGCAIGENVISQDSVAIGLNTTNPNALWVINAGNPPVGPPGLYVKQQIDRILYDCITETFEVSSSYSYDDGFVTITAKRLADTDEKNFEVRISESTDPSSTGEARMCKKQWG